MNIKEKNWYPIVYIFIATLILSTILIIFGAFTRQRVQSNERIAFERAVLEASPIETAGKSLSEIHQMFLENIKDSNESSAGALRYLQNDSLIAYVLPIQGPGFWAPIKGVIGIAADKMTITGISFYEQNETPGLGGEIVKPNFRRQFIGKKIKEEDIPLEIRMPGMELDTSSVHAVTGATQTSTRLGAFMNQQLTAWREAVKDIKK